DANTQKITSAVQGVFDELNDPKLSMFHMSGQTGDLGFGGDYHPTVAQHRENALELVDYLEGLTGWPTAPYYKSARVAADGMSVQVEVSEPLGEIPHNGGIQVILDGVPAECTSATLSDNNDDTFIVTLAKRIHQDQKVRISYRNGGIMSKNLIRLLPFYNKEAVNPVIETFIISASVHSEGTKISTLFNKRITEIEPDSFTLFIDGEEITPATDITFIIDNTNEIVMDLNDQIFDDQTIMLGLLVGAVTGFDGVINDVTANYPVENYSIISNTNVSESGDAIKVFPNPVTDRFCIAGSKATSIKHIGIYDGHGRLVAKYKSGPEGSYNVAGLARGVYFCRIYFKDNKEKVTTVKMVKR
ncbi:MAG TPA: SGNH/GDSL hydrolase family protein, partial [Bacteroidales bacterium]|nr:SGNH/GDSL hydrolase family protein [Bacteroidales bacterium]